MDGKGEPGSVAVGLVVVVVVLLGCER
jgi:hypothetical protein